MSYKPRRGTYEIDRIIRPLGRVRLRTGTTDKRIAERYEVMLGDVPLEVVRMLRDKVITLREVYDLWSRGETRLLPSAQSVRPLAATMLDWAGQHEGDVSGGETDKRLATVRLFERLHGTARLRELPAVLQQLRQEYRDRGSAFNHIRTICMAFVRDVLGKHSELHQAVADVRKHRTPPKLARHPCTVLEAKTIRGELREPWNLIWWAMCCTGMGPKEYFMDGWRVLPNGIEIAGQKRPARNRIVPLVVEPVKAGTVDGLEAVLLRADLGVAPYDARRSYARWLAELRLPDYRRNAYMGHGPKSMLELYPWGDVTEWLGQDGLSLRQYVGEPIQLRVQA